MSLDGRDVLVWLEGAWRDATVEMAHVHGLTTVVPHEDRGRFLAEWIALTPEEVLVDDPGAWRQLHARWGGGAPLTAQAWHRGMVGDRDVPIDATHTLFKDAFAAFAMEPVEHLDVELGYRVLRFAGYCATELMPGHPGLSPWFRLYWNQLRMGGRDPAGHVDPGLSGLVARLSTPEAEPHPKRLEALDAFERKAGIALPPIFSHVFSLPHIEDRFFTLHPNNPDLDWLEEWEPITEARTRGFSGDVAFPLVKPHQGEHHWWAAYSKGDDDVRVDLRFREDDAEIVPVAPTFAWFVEDLAQAGECWKQWTQRSR